LEAGHDGVDPGDCVVAVGKVGRETSASGGDGGEGEDVCGDGGNEELLSGCVGRHAGEKVSA